jgi:CheY-like chemotaxis protein
MMNWMCGYQAIVCRDGNEGLKKVQELSPDLIILDVMMPEAGGVNMYRSLKTHPKLKNIPVIMLSAVGKKSFSHYLKMLNAQTEGSICRPEAYLEKPLDEKELLTLAEQLLN